MRTIKYLSPTSLNTYYTDPYQFFYQYLADNRPDREPQTPPMAVGSSFDAFVKSELHSDIFGTKDGLSFEDLFEAQVEEQNRDEALDNGRYLLSCYKKSGCYKELLEDISNGSDPRFEFTVQGEVQGVPILGKPDCHYTRDDGVRVLLDWKVNGFYSKSTTSPAKNYKKVVDTWDESVAKSSRNNLQAHKNYQPILVGDYEIGALPFELCGQWSDQLSMYLWVLGEPVGTDAIVAVDQLACKPNKPPLIRVAQHRGRLSEEYQSNLMSKLLMAWTNIQDGYIFTDRTREENDNELKLLNESCTCMADNDLMKALRF